MKKIIVAGGCGFIGSHLCEQLIEQGDEVYCVDNVLTGSRQNVEALTESKRFKVIEEDISRPIKFSSDVDEVYHLASPASPKDFARLSLEIMSANALGAHNLLNLCREKQARFLLASTSEVYGDPEVHPQPEDYWGRVNPIGPRSPYDVSKRYAEALTVAFCRTHKLRFGISRIFNTYGPRMGDDGRVISNFIRQALAGQPLTVYGDGKQTRSFCYVSDLVRGLILCMQKAAGVPINLGSSEEMTILDLAKTIIRLSSSQSTITFASLPEDDPQVRRPDTERAKQLLGWQPTITLESGIQKTLHQFR